MDSTTTLEPLTTKPRTLEALKADNLPRLDWRELFVNVKPGELSTEDEKAFDEYFPQFLKPEGGCVMCGAQQGAKDIIDALIGANFRWGIVHGEGFCGKCRYPGRAYHRNVGPIKFFNMILQYHPDELSREAPSVVSGNENQPAALDNQNPVP